MMWTSVMRALRQENKSDKERKILYDFLYVGSKKAKLIESESTMLVARGWRWGKWGDVGQSAQTSGYR